MKLICRVTSVLLVICSLSILPAVVFAEDGAGLTNSAQAESAVPASLSIDNQNIYDGMDKSYSEGYVPRVSEGYATVVIPLICDGELEGNKLRAKINLGDSSNMPFVCKNYEKTVHLTSGSLYLISFSLELKQDRINGNYPVSFDISAVDEGGNRIQENITLYIVITDGKDPESEQKQDEEITLKPKIIVKSCECTAISDEGETAEIKAGDRIKVRVTLLSTSRTYALRNMTVTASVDSEGFILRSTSDCQYIESVDAGKEFDVIFEYDTKTDIPAGQHNITLSWDFEYGEGMSSSGTGSARIMVTQPLEMELSVMQIPSSVVISDTIEVGFKAINLSRAKAYSVRAVIEADGFSPNGTAFIGDVEGGMSGECAVRVDITGLTKGNFSYGETKGTVTFYYNDSDGNEQTEVRYFYTTIESPFSKQPADEDKPGQWWVIMAVIAVIIAVFFTVLIIKRIKRYRKNEMDE